jgi:tetratricopeptide (TPR) repeat protein
MKTVNKGKNRNSLLVTAMDLFNALKPTYWMLRDHFDPYNLERGKTSQIAQKAFSKRPCVCAACGEQTRTGLSLRAAHIVAVAECGETTEDNLVRLCDRDKQNRPDSGCHWLFDTGYASVDEMKEARTIWTSNKSSFLLREKMIKRYKRHQKSPSTIGSSRSDSIQELFTRGAPVKALQEAENRLKKTTDAKERFRLYLKIIELRRRRSARGELERASELFTELSKESKVPTEFKSWFHYEGGYLQLLLGHHDKARREFEISLLRVDKKERYWEGQWSAAVSLIVLTTIACERAKAPYAKLRRRFEKALNAARSAGEIHGKRWILNCLLHLTSLSLAEGDQRRAQNCLEKAIEHWQKMTVLEGWDRAFRPTILAITGKVHAVNAKTRSDTENALKYLTRALVGIIWRGENLSGARDVLFATAQMLKLMGKHSHAK